MNFSQRSHDPVLLVRKRGGFEGEWERSCHLVPLPDGTQSALLTLCGERIDVGSAELLPEPEGMPCVACLLVAPPPRT
ncbi:hypothetical protein F4560_004657 [Saccharothrix ecbatanensis]|uniref:Uncharacterized protein n=1 Tax=Saccharothrix ecbatanensis TaxID=1105145 RepID=A0A7W9HM98_9PSEU|nr:hypothetical protein [Saccharothrix ecbatanensis]MBB5804889.1 hypothetical protein [Saccharothrix ecbatanensis]